MDRAQILAIDPFGCGCTECVIGEYKPLQSATDQELLLMLAGVIRNNTGMQPESWDVSVTLKSPGERIYDNEDRWYE